MHNLLTCMGACLKLAWHCNMHVLQSDDGNHVATADLQAHVLHQTVLMLLGLTLQELLQARGMKH